MPLHTLRFRGMVPRSDPRQLDADHARIARNCWLTRGNLRPLGAAVMRANLALQAALPVPVAPVPVAAAAPDPPDAPADPLVAGAPGKPIPPTLSITAGEALFAQWSAPGAGGAAIDGYDLQTRPAPRYEERVVTRVRRTLAGDQHFTVVELVEVDPQPWTDYPFSGTATQTDIGGLPDNDHEVRVRARNANGAGPWSEPGRAVGASLLTIDVFTSILRRISYGRDGITAVDILAPAGGGNALALAGAPQAVAHVSDGVALVATRVGGSSPGALYRVAYDADGATGVVRLGDLSGGSVHTPPDPLPDDWVRDPTAMAVVAPGVVLVHDRDDGKVHRVGFTDAAVSSVVLLDGTLSFHEADEGDVGAAEGFAFIGDGELLAVKRRGELIGADNQRRQDEDEIYLQPFTDSALEDSSLLGRIPNPPDGPSGAEGIAHVTKGIAVVANSKDSAALEGPLFRIVYGDAIRRVDPIPDPDDLIPDDTVSLNGLAFIGRTPAPVQPPVVAATAVEDRHRATWTAPADGGSAITGYDYRHSSGQGYHVDWSDPVAVGAAVRSADIDGVPHDEEIAVQVRARSALGTGGWSPSGIKLRPGAPAAPPGERGSVPTLAPGDDGEILVSYSPPATTGSAPIIAYEILVREVDAAAWPAAPVRTDGPTTSHTLTGLAGVDYAVVVRAVNANGAGPYSAEARGRRGYPRRLTALGSIYRFGEDAAAAGSWFAWPGDVDVQRGPLARDDRNRTYWTGEDVPRLTTTAIVGDSFAGGIPPSRRLGVPPPAPPTVEPPAALADPDNPAFHVWTMTFVTDLGEEGPPSFPTPIVERSLNSAGNAFDAAVLHLPTAAAGYPGVTRKRLYRAVGDPDELPGYRLIAEVPVAQEAYRDVLPDTRLGSELVSTQWDPPPADLKGLQIMPNGIAVGFVGRDLYFSVPHQPHAWPRDYSLAFEDGIVGLGIVGTSVVVCTESYPHFVSGTEPELMRQSRIELPQACVSKRSIAEFGRDGVLYASPDGLVRVASRGAAELVTENLFDVEAWRTFSPEDFTAVHHDTAYVALRGDGAIAVDPQFDGLVEFDAAAGAAWVDRRTDRLYLARNAEILEWDAGTPLLAEWRSRTDREPRARVYSTAQVFADEYRDTVLEVWADGVLRHSQNVVNARPFRLRPRDPGGLRPSRARDWEFVVKSEGTVTEVYVGHMRDLRG